MNLYAKAYWSNNPIHVNQQINNPDFIINVPIGVIVGSSDVTKSYVDQQDAALSAQIDTKLDASDYVQHFRGVFVNLAALQAAIPVGINGDYAHIDLGVGFDRKVAIWDTDDNKWIESTGSVALTTDEVTEGNTNKYFTDLRVRNTVLSGLVKTDQSNVSNTDTVEVAIGKLAARDEAGGSSGFNWVDITTVGAINSSFISYTSINFPNDTCKIEVARKDGMLWIRGDFYVTTNITATPTKIFEITSNNYKILHKIESGATYQLVSPTARGTTPTSSIFTYIPSRVDSIADIATVLEFRVSSISAAATTPVHIPVTCIGTLVT